MSKKSGFLVITLLLASTLTLALSVRRAEANGDISIMADGSVQGTTNIQTADNVTYFFTTDIIDCIVVDRDNIILDGRGFSLSGDCGTAAGIYLPSTTNVTIRNLTIKDHYYSIFLRFASNCTISRCSGLSSSIGLDRSSNNVISGNNIESSSTFAIWLMQSDNNTICGNTMMGTGINLDGSNFNSISRNKIMGASTGILLASGYIDGIKYSSNNIVTGNWIENNSIGVEVAGTSNNTIYHNNFIGNAQQAYVMPGYSNDSTNFWDNGYPSGGNYWSDYNGTDLHSGPYQNETGSDGVGDVSYMIDGNNTDRYPLIHLYVPLFGDLNQDGTVDMYDALLAAKAFGSTPSNPNWTSVADLNGDGNVDIFDLIMLAQNFGKMYHP